MLFSEIRNRPVVSVAGAERLGFIDDILVDTEHSRVAGFVVRHGGIVTHHEAMLLEDVHAFGEDAVTVSDASKLNAQDKFAPLHSTRSGSQLFGSRVLDADGQQIGSLIDVDADFSSGAITSWLLRGGFIERLRGQSHAVSPDAVQSIGDGLMVVRAGANIS